MTRYLTAALSSMSLATSTLVSTAILVGCSAEIDAHRLRQLNDAFHAYPDAAEAWVFMPIDPSVHATQRFDPSPFRNEYPFLRRHDHNPRLDHHGVGRDTIDPHRRHPTGGRHPCRLNP